MTTKVIKYESAEAMLVWQEDGRVFLMNLISRERGQGHATNLMKRIITFADQQGLTLTLTVKQFGNPHGALNNEQLQTFYTLFGFVVTKKERRQPVEMERKPGANE